MSFPHEMQALRRIWDINVVPGDSWWQEDGLRVVFDVDGQGWYEAPPEVIAKGGNAGQFEPFVTLLAEEDWSGQVRVGLGKPGQIVHLDEPVLDENICNNPAWQIQNASRPRDWPSSPILSHLNAAVRTIETPACAGLRLIKTYDRFHGRQRARVLIDGEEVGLWCEPLQDRDDRIFEGFFDAIVPLEAGKHEITIDPPAGTPLWSVGHIQIRPISKITP